MVYFLSDAHLGSRAIENSKAHQQTLIDMLQCMARDAHAIYLLGDIFDFWCEYFWNDTSKEQYRPFLQAIKDITAKTYGSRNKVNCVKATLDALTQLRSKEEIAALRGKTVEEIL